MTLHPRAEHVWVALTGVWGDAALPGLIVSWRQDETTGTWLAWVISAEPGIGAHDSGPYIRMSWVPASAVRPVGGEPPAGRGSS